MPGLGWRIAGAAACWIAGVAIAPHDAGVWILKLLLMADGLLLIGLPRLAGPAAAFAPLWRPRHSDEPRLWRGWLPALLAELRAWRKRVQAPVPTEPNPQYDPAAEAKAIAAKQK